MKKVWIVNKVDNRTFGNFFESDKELQSWIDNNIQINSWGKPERWKREDLLEEYEQAITPIEIREVEGREGKLERELKLPCDYEIIITDITTEYNLEKNIMDSVKIGIESRATCSVIYDYLGGQLANVETSTVDDFIRDHANLMQVLQANRPRALKKLLKNVNPNRILTQGMIDAINHILNKRGY